MDKKDVMYAVAAIAIILVMALVVKPMMTGQPVNTGIPVPATPAIIQNATIAPVTSIIPTTIVTTPSPVPTPTPLPTWNEKVQTVGFVNPSDYGVSLTEALPNSTRIDNLPLDTSMTSYAKINGQYSGTTQVIKIPFPYWELVYTVEPVAETKVSSAAVSATKGSGVSSSGVQGSYSSATPAFTIQVMDADDPNRIVRTISPPGGIDINLWLGIKGTINPASTVKKGRETTSADTVYTDPRPWTEKFFEGQRSYYFIINSQLIKSYSIDIRVPTRYVGTV
ncbi:MAG: hypothetical protein M0Q91_18670 [Methanoregula sp.]|jgi:hypothetical protein|nr:hypothetical protein [Methanoregula sp.]